MSSRSGSKPRGDGSGGAGLLAAGVLAIALVRGVARRPVVPAGSLRSDTTGVGRDRRGGEISTPAGTDGARPETFADAFQPGLPGVAKAVAAKSKANNLTLLAAGVAFYAVMSLFPAMVAVVSIYGLVADPADVSEQLADVAAALPQEAADIIVGRMEALAASGSSSLGLSAGIGIAVALWSASSGMSWLMRALTLVYDEEETRTFVPLRAWALLLTFGAIIGLAVTVMLITAASALAGSVGIGEIGQQVISVLRWPVLALVMVFGLALLYRYGPNRSVAQLRWASWGAGVGMAVWLLASGGFAIYVSVAGNNSESYGSLAGIIVLMLWLWLTCVAILLGAQVNAVLESKRAPDDVNTAG